MSDNSNLKKPKQQPVETQQLNPSSPSKIILNKDTRWFIMWDISIIHGLMCIAPGILSSCITQMRKDLKLSDEKFGLFGTIYGFGSLLGSLIFTIIIEKINHKLLIITMLLINCICHFAFYFKLNYDIMLLSRFISGFVCVICFIYYPMWVDKFGIKNWVNFMQTTVQVSNTIGAILGYLIFLILGSKNWANGFLIESISISFCVFLLIFVPSKYFDKNFHDYEREENFLDNNNEIIKNIEKKESIFKDIICNLPYILITLYRGNRIFIYVAIYFWYEDYIEFVLVEKNSKIIFFSFSITMVISSLIGNILGGVILNLVGGQKSKYLFFSMLILQFFSVIFGILSPLKNSVLHFSALMSLYMLINSASGIISISASFAVMPKTLKGTATGIYSIIVSLIAYLPAPYAFAFIKKWIKNESKVILILMMYGLIGCFELVIADFYMRYKKIFIHKESFVKYDKLDEKNEV